MSAMTPEERAQSIVMDYYARRCWGYDPNQHAEYEKLIANAIRAAEAEMLERCAKALEEEADRMDALGIRSLADKCIDNAARIRALREPTE